MSSLWRQSYGERYKYIWHQWYRQLSNLQRSEYQKCFPAPLDKDLCWEDFYNFIAEVPARRDSITDFIIGRIPK